MSDTFLIESADPARPLDPHLLRELRDLLREDEDLDLGVSLKNRAPAPGEQGAIPVAVEVVAVLAPTVRALAGVLTRWIASRHVEVRLSVPGRSGRKGRSVELSAGNAADAERLLRALADADDADDAHDAEA